MLNYLNFNSIRTKLLSIIMISAIPVVLAFLYFIKVEYDQSYKVRNPVYTGHLIRK